EPISASGRVRYTCVAASEHYLAFGANTGGLYCFERSSLRFLRLIAGKDGAVSAAAFGPDESRVAVGTSRGVVVVFDHSCASPKSRERRVLQVNEHKGRAVTAVAWDERGYRLFCADETGKVVVAHLVAS